MPEFKLPDVGEGLTEAEIVSWKVKQGDTVAINDIICEIETAKSIVELPSPFAGTVQKLMVPEGETVYVVCAMGGRSMRAAEHLAGLGRDVVNVAGGTKGWIEAGHPTVAGDQPG